MRERLIDGADATRNVALTVLLALTPAGAAAFDGSASLELSYGNKTFSSSLIGDWGLVPDKVYLVGSFGAVRQAPLAGITSSPSYLLGLGLDVLPSLHWVTSLNLSFSPRATDTEHVMDSLLMRSRRSAQGVLVAGYQSAGFDDLEWSADVSALAAWYELASSVQLPMRTINATTPLAVVKPAVGFTLIVMTTNELGLRGSYSWYSADPTTAGGLDELLPAEVRDSNAFQAIEAQYGRYEASANFSAAPPWFDARVSLLHRFGTRLTGRFAYTFTRYVHGLGNAHAVSTKWTIKLAGWARVWAAATIQYDQLNAEPSFYSGYGTLGAELATE